MSRVALLAAFIIAATAAAPTFADTLRCGSSVIQEGDAQIDVEKKCGAPSSKQTLTEPVYARNVNGTTRQVGTTSKDVWRYDRGSRAFPAVLTFEKGVLKKLEFEK